MFKDDAEIQHPNGKAKRFGIRNDLVSASTDTDLRYFIDTEGGPSVSLDDVRNRFPALAAEINI
jgi:hypothetical protein